MTCPHHHLRFEDGQLYLVCIDCSQTWLAVVSKVTHLPAAQLRQRPAGLPLQTTRHERFQLPRDQKKS